MREKMLNPIAKSAIIVKSIVFSNRKIKIGFYIIEEIMKKLSPKLGRGSKYYNAIDMAYILKV